MEDYKKIILDFKNTNAEQRIQAAFHLENIPTEEAVETLGKALETDPSPIARHEHAFVLGETASPKLASKFLMKAAESDSSVFVRHESILALATLGDNSIKPFIEKFLKDPDKHISESVEIALQRLKFTSKR